MVLLKINSWSEILIGSVIGIVVVFIALIILVLLFDFIQYLVLNSSKKKMVKAGKKVEEMVDVSANEIAAISMALHLFINEMHDEESNVITIKRIERRYSPWNSKIYGLNNTLQR
jgi:Na+-transporting methylmalonyl-CoA/oxaloacetate decarboxylase gamma subunit